MFHGLTWLSDIGLFMQDGLGRWDALSLQVLQAQLGCILRFHTTGTSILIGLRGLVVSCHACFGSDCRILTRPVKIARFWSEEDSLLKE